MRVVLLGPPGAGKGTLAGAIKEKFDVIHISTGDILRDEMKSSSELGYKAKSFVESGGLVPDEIVIKLIENKLVQESNQAKGYLFDGFPRTEKQASDLDKILKGIGQPIELVLYMETTLPVIIQRLSGRRICKNCGAIYHLTNKPPKTPDVCDECSGELYQRPDDNEETIRNRMDVYLKNTMPIVDFYIGQKKLEKVDANQETAKVLNFLAEVVHE